MEKTLSNRFIILFLSFTVLALYYPLIFAPFNPIDDPDLCQHLLNMETCSLRTIFLSGGNGTYYRPLLELSFIIDKYVWGIEESFMHLHNILLHLVNTLLVFAIAKHSYNLSITKSVMPILLPPLFFAIHPINSESVNWISGRTDLLACFFILFCIYFLLIQPTRMSNSFFAVTCFLLACLTKETAVFFFPALFIYPFFVNKEGNDWESIWRVLRNNYPHFIFSFCAGIGYFVFRAIAFRRGDNGIAKVVASVSSDYVISVTDIFRIILKASGFYLKKLFVPFPLNFGITHVSDLYVFIGIIYVILICWLFTRRTLTAYFFLSAASIAVAALIIPLIGLTWTPLAERYMYIPSALFLLGITRAVSLNEAIVRHRLITVIIVGSLLIVGIFGTAQRNMLWQDNFSLFSDCMKKSPDFLPAQNQIAVAMLENGQEREAMARFDSLQVPDNVINFQYGLINKAVARKYAGDFAGARKLLLQALQNPGKNEVKVIKSLLKLNDLEVINGHTTADVLYAENVSLLSRLFEITGDSFYLYRQGIVHLQAGDRGKAQMAFAKVAQIAPDTIYYRKPAERLAIDLSK